MRHSVDSPVSRIPDIRRRFDNRASTFERFDFIFRTAREGLLGRLEPMTVGAKTVLDLGCAVGAAGGPLRRRFRRAQVVGVDLSRTMLTEMQKRQPWYRKALAVQADACRLPVADHGIDVVFSNLLLPWIEEPSRLFAEVARVLRADGLFLFATLGPDSFRSLRHAWTAAGRELAVDPFLDMHDVGDAIVRSGLRDPVLDVDRTTATYKTLDPLLREGIQFLDLIFTAGVGGDVENPWQTLDDARTGDDVLPVELELVYGHCWGSGPVAPAREYRVDPAQIGRRGRPV